MIGGNKRPESLSDLLMVKEPTDKDRTGGKPKSMLSSPHATTQNSLSSKRPYCDFLLKNLPSMVM